MQLPTPQSNVTQGTKDTSSLWWQCIFGKVAPLEGGPITPGFEHRCTGRSTDIPSEVAKQCVPHVIGIGTGDQGSWSSHHWKSYGGITLQPIVTGDSNYLVAARIRGRSESGEGVPGRLYTQAQYLVANANELRSLPLLDLPTALVAQPMTQVDLELPRVPVGIADWSQQRGAKKWLDEKSQDYLLPLLCGKPVSVQNWEMQPAEFYQLAMWVLACLPHDIRWRIPIGCGMQKIEGVGLGHGMQALGGVRLISTDWRGKELLSAESVSKAQVYIEHIKEIVHEEGIESLEELTKRIDSEFQDLSAQNQPSLVKDSNKSSWVAAMALLVDLSAKLQPLNQFRRYLKFGQLKEQPDLRSIKEYRLNYLQELIGSIRRSADQRNRALTLLVQVAHWDQEWRTLAEHESADSVAVELSMVLGHTPLDIDRFQSIVEFDLPPELDQQIFLSLMQAMVKDAKDKDTDTAIRWVPIIQIAREASQIRWLSSWATNYSEEHMLFIFRILIRRPSQIELLKLLDTKNAPLVRRVLEAITPQKAPARLIESHIQDLVTWIRGTKKDNSKLTPIRSIVIKTLVHTMRHQRLHCEAIILYASLLGSVYHYLLIEPEDSTKRIEILNSIAERIKDFPNEEVLVQVLLSDWHSIDKTLSSKIEAELSKQIGGEMALIYFKSIGHSNDSKFRNAATRALPMAMCMSPRIQDATLQLCCKSTSDSLFKSIFNWACQGPTGIVAKSDVLACLRKACSGELRSLPDATAEQAMAMSKILPARLDKLPSEIHSIGQLRTGIALGSSAYVRQLQISSKAIGETLNELLEEPQRGKDRYFNFWKPWIVKLDLQEVSPWNLLAQVIIDSRQSSTKGRRSVRDILKFNSDGLDVLEGESINYCSGRSVLRLLLLDCKLPRNNVNAILDKVKLDDLIYVNPTLSQMEQLLQVTSDHGSEEMILELFRFMAFMMISGKYVTRKDIREKLFEPPSGYRFGWFGKKDVNSNIKRYWDLIQNIFKEATGMLSITSSWVDAELFAIEKRINDTGRK